MTKIRFYISSPRIQYKNHPNKMNKMKHHNGNVPGTYVQISKPQFVINITKYGLDKKYNLRHLVRNVE